MAEPSQCATVTVGLHILLVGDCEEDFFLIRDLLKRTEGAALAQLDHAVTFTEAVSRLNQVNYDLIFLAYEAGANTARDLLSEIHRRNVTVPLVFLTEGTDEATVARIIRGGACDCVSKSELTESSLLGPVRCALSLRGKEHRRRDAEEMLRKLSRAVEQSADLVIITDRNGVIEYVNPAFEALTGYTRQEVIGQNRAF